MEDREIDCPYCRATAIIRVDSDISIYRIEAYDDDPEEARSGLFDRRPTPKAVTGERLYLDRHDQYRRQAVCGSGHHVRILGASYTEVPRDRAVVPPLSPSKVECPGCGFEFGAQDEYTQVPDESKPEQTHVLREVTTSARQGHTQVPSLTDGNLIEHDRLAKEQDCPHCGTTVAFNFRKLLIEEEVEPVKITNE